MKEIVFATNNAHKLREIREITGPEWRVLSLADIGCSEDIPETADTLQGNAALKACYIRDKYGYDCCELVLCPQYLNSMTALTRPKQQPY